MMTAQLEVPLGYSPDLEARLLELPLAARRMSLFLVLVTCPQCCETSNLIFQPDYLDPGIHQLEANFTTHHVKALMATLQVGSRMRDRIQCTRHLFYL